MKNSEVRQRMEDLQGYLNHVRFICERNITDSDAQRGLLIQLAKIDGVVKVLKQEAATKKLMTTGIIADDELLARFAATSPRKGERMFEATLIPNGETSTVTNWDQRNFTAPNKAEAVKIAREYAERIAKMKLVYVYLAR